MAEKKSEIKIKAPCHVKDLGTAVRIYYSYPEMSNKEIKELFGRDFSGATLARYKSMIRQRQRELGVKTAIPHSVNTNVAFEVFGLDIGSIERNYAKLKKLGMESQKGGDNHGLAGAKTYIQSLER